MKIKLFSPVLFLFLIYFLTGCNVDNVVANFTYTPTTPKNGQIVYFTDATTGDNNYSPKYWNWNFGDGSTSQMENPEHVYSASGTYTVTLEIDSNRTFVKSLDITIADSIPTIHSSVDTIKYYTDVTFSVYLYNPDALDVTYDWGFPTTDTGGDDLTDGHTDASTATVFFTKKDTNEVVQLHLIMGDQLDTTIYDTVFVHNIKAKSLLIASKNGDILRKRLFERGFEDYTSTGISSGKHPFNICAQDNQLYIFDAGSNIQYNSDWLTDTSGDGAIRKIDMSNDQETEVINNKGTSSYFGFYNGFVKDNDIYWTDYSDFVYKTPTSTSNQTFEWKGSSDAQTAVPYYLVKADRLGYYGDSLANGQFSGGIYDYDDVYFWAKGGTGKGIYRFTSADILQADATGSEPVPSLGAILTDYSIRAFTIDEINQKIYFSVTAPADKIGFYVANISGTNVTRIDDSPMDNANEYITGIVVDNSMNEVYWAYRKPVSDASDTISTHQTGIKMATLATQFQPAGSIKYLQAGIAAYGLALDNVAKK